MKKTILASAIAAASFSGAAMAAEHESNMPTVYGNIQYAIAHTDTDGGPSDVQHYDNGSTIGIKHDHAITSGIEGFFKAEFHFDADANDANDEKDDGIYDIDEAYVGVRGDSFGQVWIGKDDSTYETAVDEINQFFEAASLSLSPGYQTGEDDLVQYRSPSFGGLTLGAAVQFNGDSDPRTGGDKSYPYQLAAMYELDALELAFAVDSNDGAGSDENTYGLRASYNLDDLRLTGEYHTTKDAQDKFGVMGAYTIGANVFAAAYEMIDADAADSDETTITLQAKRNLSDNMYIYAEGYIGGGDDVYTYDSNGDGVEDASSDEKTVAAVGAVYYF